MARNPRILFTGGGTGGHIYPLLAVIEEIRKKTETSGIAIELHYLGPNDAFTLLLYNAGVSLHALGSAKLRRYISGAFLNIIDTLKLPFIFLQALFKVYAIMPEVIFSKGGTGALPVVFAGWFYRIPIVLHESDAVPGLTNLASAFFAFRIAVGFEEAAQSFSSEKVAVTGNPVRADLLDDIPKKEIAKEQLGFSAQEPLVLVTGGSQGSAALNEFVITNLQALLVETQIFHITGKAQYAEIEALERVILADMPVKAGFAHHYQAIPYAEENLKAILAAADVVVCRSGAGTLYELAAFGKPAILVPLPESGNDHQRANAYAFAKGGGGVVIEQNNLLPGVFVNQVKTILKTPGILDQMSVASLKFFRPGAAGVIADELLAIAKIITQ